jgi:type II secretory pathway pseudopilin PulG
MMRSRFQVGRIAKRGESGYVLLTLLLILALMAIAAGMVASSIAFEIKRDKEEEMIHRGVQYSRAIRAYYKKFSRYPAKIEDLENTNQMRFLRKRYKDPLTGKDFRILHYGEAKMSMNALGGAGIAGANSIGPNGTLTTQGGLGQTSSFGGNSTFGNSMNSSFGQNSQQPGPGSAPATTDSGQSGAQASADNSNSPTTPGSNNLNGNSGDKLSNTQFGGAPIVGVASLSKDTTIREFDKKKKYNEWQFVYDPTFDRGFLITTPYQPSLQQALGMQGTTNLNGQNNSGQSGSGFGNSFGNSSSPMQNNSISPGSGYGSPSPSPSPTQPQNSPQQQ